MTNKLIYGVGVYEKGEYQGHKGTIPNKVRSKEYEHWTGMLRRCYSQKFHEKNHTYKGCTVSSSFSNFQFFAGWCQSQIGFGEKGYQLDKDILCKGGSKVYSEDTCVFVPSQVNNLLHRREADRGDCPIGVYLHKASGKFVARVRTGKTAGSKCLGYYDTSQEAFLKYKKAKEEIIKQVAEEYKDKLDLRVYKALLEYEVTGGD